MPATVTTKPTYAIPTRQSRVIFTPADGSCNFIRVWATLAPEGTAIDDQIKKSKLSRALVYQGPPRELFPWRYTFEQGGKYTLPLQEYVRGNSWGGGYEGDPRGAPSETQLGGEQGLELYIAKRLTQRLGFGEDTATLVIFLHNDTVVQTLEGVHGEQTPAIIDPTSERAAAAATAAASVTAMNQLVGLTSFSVLNQPGSVVDGYIDDFVSHAQSGTHHQTADVQADLEEYAAGLIDGTWDAIARAVVKLRRRFELHLLNARENDPDNPGDVLPGSVLIHSQGGRTFDNVNTLLPLSVSANDPATIFAAMGDFWRAYEEHRVASLHETPDTTFNLSTPSGLLRMHREFMTSLAAAAPEPGQGMTTGAARLVGGGFEEG